MLSWADSDWLRILFSVNISLFLFLLGQYYIACVYIKGSSKYMQITESLNSKKSHDSAGRYRYLFYLHGSSTYLVNCHRISSSPFPSPRKKNESGATSHKFRYIFLGECENLRPHLISTVCNKKVAISGQPPLGMRLMEGSRFFFLNGRQ